MEPLYLILAAGAVVWAVVLVLRLPLGDWCLLYLLSGCILGAEVLSIRVAGAAVSLDRLVLLGLGATFLVRRQAGQTTARPLAAADGCLLAFVAWLAVSMLTGDWRLEEPGQVAPMFRLLAGYAFPLLVYWAARQAPLEGRDWRRMQWVLGGFGLYLGLTGILEIGQQWHLVFPTAIADPALGQHFGRARGPMLSSISYGLFLGACLMAVVLCRPRGGSLAWLLPIVAALPMVAGVYFSYTRSVWLGVAGGLLVMAAVGLRGRARLAVVGGAVLAGGLVLAANWDRFLGFQRELTASDTRESADMRRSFVYVSWRMFLDAPLLGVGFGQFPLAKLPYLDDRTVDLKLQNIRPLVHHNTYLDILVETGLVGLALFAAVLWHWSRTAWRLARAADAPDWIRRHGLLQLGLLVLWGWQLLGHELSYAPQDNALAFFIAGLGTNLALRQGLLAAAIPAARRPRLELRPVQTRPGAA